MKNVPIRVPVDLHLKVKRRMLDVFGDDNFQKLIVRYLEQFAESGSDASELAGRSSKAAASFSAKEQAAVERFLAFLRVASKQELERVENYMAAQMELASMSQPEGSSKKMAGR